MNLNWLSLWKCNQGQYFVISTFHNWTLFSSHLWKECKSICPNYCRYVQSTYELTMLDWIIFGSQCSVFNTILRLSCLKPVSSPDCSQRKCDLTSQWFSPPRTMGLRSMQDESCNGELAQQLLPKQPIWKRLPQISFLWLLA